MPTGSKQTLSRFKEEVDKPIWAYTTSTERYEGMKLGISDLRRKEIVLCV